MTNLFLEKIRGAATLIITVIMLVTITSIILFAASYNLFQEKVTSNGNQNNQAYEAAEAGLEFGLEYLQNNASAILANPVNGYIPAYSSSSTQNVVLTNNSKFTIAYSNPIQNNYTIILITSTGTSSDGTSVRTVSQKTASNSLFTTPPTIPLINQGSIGLSGNAIISNPNTNSTVNSGGVVSFIGNAQTLITGGRVGSNRSSTGSDVTQNNTALTSMTNTAFFQTFFGSSEAAVQAVVKHSYTNSTTTDYTNALTGMTGTSIWITQTSGQANIDGNAIIGSASNPVLIIVNGNLNISGNAQIYGFVYVIGGVATGLSGNAIVQGGVVATDTLNISGNTHITFSSSILSALQVQSDLVTFAKVPGTWRDF